MKREGLSASASTVHRGLARHGAARIPRRSPGEREAALRPVGAPPAAARELDLSPRRLRTSFGGLFLFGADLIRLDLEGIAGRSGLSGSAATPAGHALRSLLALKLWGIGRPPAGLTDSVAETATKDRRSNGADPWAPKCCTMGSDITCVQQACDSWAQERDHAVFRSAHRNCPEYENATDIEESVSRTAGDDDQQKKSICQTIEHKIAFP